MASVCPSCMMSRRSALGLLAAMPLVVSAKAARLPTELPVVDFHTHVFDDAVPLPARPALQGGRPEWFKQMNDPREHIAQMDRVGIDRHVVSQVTVMQGIDHGEGDAEVDYHRRVNDRLAGKWVAPHGNRFIAAFGLPTRSVAAARAELERVVTRYDARIVQLSSCTSGGVYYGDPSLTPLWEAFSHFGVTAFIHPHGQANSPPLDQFGLWNSVGQGIEEIKAMTSLIYGGVFDKFPDLKVLIAHGGGFLPHYYGRMDRNVSVIPGSGRNIARLPSEYLKTFYYDTCVYAPETLAALIRVVGTDRIVLGGDFPMGPTDPVALSKTTPGLASADVHRILRTNAARLLTRMQAA